MATARARARQRAEALQRLTAATDALALALGIDPPVIPTHYRDAGHLPTMQMETVAAFLEAAGQTVGPDGVVRMPEPASIEAVDFPAELDGSGNASPLPSSDTEKVVIARKSRKVR